MVQKKLGDYGKKSPAKSPAKTTSGKRLQPGRRSVNMKVLLRSPNADLIIQSV